jgi:hypothetical protein
MIILIIFNSNIFFLLNISGWIIRLRLIRLIICYNTWVRSYICWICCSSIYNLWPRDSSWICCSNTLLIISNTINITRNASNSIIVSDSGTWYLPLLHLNSIFLSNRFALNSCKLLSSLLSFSLIFQILFITVSLFNNSFACCQMY